MDILIYGHRLQKWRFGLVVDIEFKMGYLDPGPSSPGSQTQGPGPGTRDPGPGDLDPGCHQRGQYRSYSS